MSAEILDGKALAVLLKEELASEIKFLEQKYHKRPHLVSILFGEDPAALSYALSQEKTAQGLGIEYELKKLSLNIQLEKFLLVLESLNSDHIHGIFLNKPLPSTINKAISFIDPMKDIEGISPINLGDLLLGKATMTPCTPAAALMLLKSSKVLLKGKHAVVIGRSDIVGKPMALLLLQEDMTVTICHSKTENLKNEVLRADVVVAAIGKPVFVKGDWIKSGAIVIDVGINSYEGRIVGDVDFESCKQKASFITPVPGGVGPVTAVMLMKNTVEAFKQSL